MSGDVYPHGSRELVADYLSANNHVDGGYRNRRVFEPEETCACLEERACEARDATPDTLASSPATTVNTEAPETTVTTITGIAIGADTDEEGAATKDDVDDVMGTVVAFGVILLVLVVAICAIVAMMYQKVERLEQASSVKTNPVAGKTE